MSARSRAVVAVCALTALAGCGANQPDPVADATQLRQNIPTQVQDHRVIAYNMDDESAVMSVDSETSEVTVGSTVTLGEQEYEVVQIVPDSGRGDGPDGWVSIREQ